MTEEREIAPGLKVKLITMPAPKTTFKRVAHDTLYAYNEFGVLQGVVYKGGGSPDPKEIK